MILCPITYYNLQKVWEEAFHHLGYIRESWNYPTSFFSWFTPNTRWDLGLTPQPHFTSLKPCKCSQIPHPSPRVTSTTSLAVGRRGSSQTHRVTTGSLRFLILILILPLLLNHLINIRSIKAGWRDNPPVLRDFSWNNKQKIRFQLPLNQTFCPTPPLLIHRQIEHPHNNNNNNNNKIFSASPSSAHRFLKQSSQYQNWYASKHSNGNRTRVASFGVLYEDLKILCPHWFWT